MRVYSPKVEMWRQLRLSQLAEANATNNVSASFDLFLCPFLTPLRLHLNGCRSL